MKPNLRVLVVDDDDAVVTFVAELLADAGFQVTATSDPGKAIRQAGVEPFDVALVDMRLPGTSGARVVRALRQVRPGLPCVVMTGFAMPDEVQGAIDAGACATLAKPFEDLAEVVRVLREAA